MVGDGTVMGSTLIMVAILAPLISAAVMVVAKPAGLANGRIVAVGCGIASLAACGVVATTGARADGIVGDPTAWTLHVNRASAFLLAAVATTGVVVASFSRRNIDTDPRSRRFFFWLAALVTCSGQIGRAHV